MELDIEKQKQEYLEICRREIHREGLEDLLNWLQKADFFTAPASTRYHGAYKGGLCQHSLDVYEFALKLADACGIEYKPEEIAVSALFHDICKVNFYKTDEKNKKVDGEWIKVPYYVVAEKLVYGGHGSKSVFLCERFMKLTIEEAVAINNHMGMAPGGDTVRDSSNAYEAFPLAWVIHAADEAAAYLLDRSPEEI